MKTRLYWVLGAGLLAFPPVCFSQVSGLRIISAVGLAGNQTLSVEFSAPVAARGATNVANYALNNGEAITNAALGSDGRSLLLHVAGGLGGGLDLTVNRVDDLAGNLIASNTTVPVAVANLQSAAIGEGDPTNYAFAYEPGSITFWTGGSGLGGIRDSFGFVYAPVTGDFDLATQLTNLVGNGSEAGLCARENLSPEGRELAAMANLQFNGQGQWETLYRPAANNSTFGWPVSVAPADLPFPNVWIRLRQQGGTFSAYSGADGTNWSLIGQISPDPPYPATLFVGLAAAGFANSAPTGASFQNFGPATAAAGKPGDDQWDVLHFRAGGGTQAGFGALAANGGRVYLGGASAPGGNGIALWTNPGWSPLGQGSSNGVGDGEVLALTFGPDGSLYAGGGFYTAGGGFSQGITRWDGTNWHALGGGVGGATGGQTVRALAFGNDGRLYLGGDFNYIDSAPANGLASWDGSGFLDVGGGVTAADETAEVTAIALNGSDLYVGGMFDHAGPVPASSIARWDGQQWDALGGGLQSSGGGLAVDAILAEGTNVFVGGLFSSAGGVAATNLARWDGQAWSAVGGGTDGEVHALAFFGDTLFAAGTFNHAGGLSVAGLARWSGAGWSAVGNGLGGPEPYAGLLAESGTNLFVVGLFGAAGGEPADNSAIWFLTNAPPTVEITSPLPGTLLALTASNAVATVLLKVEAADYGLPIQQVGFYANGQFIGVATNAPFSFAWTNASAGHYTLTAQVTDAAGLTGTSPPVGLVAAVPPPGVSLGSPAPGTAFLFGAGINLAAVVSAPAGDVSSVRFYAGTNLLGTLAGPPYSLTWSNVTTGNYNLYAMAQNNAGLAATSSVVSVSVYPPGIPVPPTVVLTSPTNGATFSRAPQSR